MTEELRVVDVRQRGDTSIFWEVHLSDGYVLHLLKANHPDELSAFARVTNKLKEQSDGTNSRA